jgi:hypothetical protein
MKLGNDPQSKLAMSPLERAVLAALAQRLGAAGAPLAAQSASARVASRSHSGVGFVTRLEVPADAPPVEAAVAARAGAVYASHPALPEPAEFLVQFRDGRLATIEAFCYAGLWPEDDAAFRVGVAPGH